MPERGDIFVPSVISRMNQTQSQGGKKPRSDNADNSHDNFYSNCLQVGCVLEVGSMWGNYVRTFIVPFLIVSRAWMLSSGTFGGRQSQENFIFLRSFIEASGHLRSISGPFKNHFNFL